MKRSGSRRQAAAVANPATRKGLPGVQNYYVAIEYYCDTGHRKRVLGTVRRSTMESGETSSAWDTSSVWAKPQKDGYLPFQEEGDHRPRVRLQCRCGRDMVLTGEKVEQALAAIWKPDIRLVVPYRI